MDVMDEIKAAVEGLVTDTKGQLGALTARLDDIEKKANRPFAPGATRGFETKIGDHTAAEIKAEHKALAKMIRTGDDVELKAMSIGSDPDGGYLVMPVLSTVIRKKLFDLSPMRRLAHIETIGSGDAWEEPTDDDDVGAGWVGETEARPETSTPQVGLLHVPLHEIYAMPKVTQRLLDDSSYDVGAWLENKIGDRFGRLEGAACVTGDGIKKPRGLLTYPSDSATDSGRARGTLQFVVSGHATLITPDALKALTWALRAPYRQNAKWLMNSMTAQAIDLFKDSQGQYIWRTGLTSAAQNTLLGFPVEIDETMPDVAAGATPIAFGDFDQGYVLVDRPGIRLLRDPYTAKPHVLFYAYRRTGGGLRSSEAIKLLKISA